MRGIGDGPLHGLASYLQRWVVSGNRAEVLQILDSNDRNSHDMIMICYDLESEGFKTITKVMKVQHLLCWS